MSKAKTTTTIGSAAVVACCVQFTPTWEGFSPVAHRDKIGTGHPVEYCYGQTDEFGVVKVGQRFTKKDCDPLLKKSMEEIYFPGVDKCVHVALPVKSMAALVDGAYNAGVARMCASPMVRKVNAGDLVGACDAFAGWIVTSDHVVRDGLIRRRAGEKLGDKRKSERALCLEGLSEPKSDWYRHVDPKPAPPSQPWYKRWTSWLFGR